ncbi:transketolase [Bariatricus massiliensis]|uniref:Transketolase n=1 Tax=Bariatricus massiliensis TaxID=1745713 RepID=A0ABS8DGK0_9FIRM|nr:transketolase C-terminal domain-containing protein [Bariatricus massiliensis]MCB7303048.1 transketolase [Bariatricus massiliensis]MCB7374264.1 transketolase [Bariatricus massiliensis]MCB7386934.1 transketolase [Bariatricus massiliensis]MCB7411096.1 transketolase [Bariatricus massiliensis]MCQ5251922.1 transketolase [Bariatricus massiliensis]
MIGNFEDPRKTFGEEVCRIALENRKIVLLSADSGRSSGFGSFMDKCPERYFEFGIMEQTMTGAASGLASTGKIPVICAIASFITARNYEMFRNDIGYMRQNVKIVGRNGGITYSDLGTTHHSLDDFGLIGMIPGVVVLAPQDPNEIREAVRAMLKYEGPVYMRIGNEKQENLFESGFEIGKARHICHGEDVTLISAGSMTANAVKACRKLNERDISVEHLGISTLIPLDCDAILESAARTGFVVTVEEHYTEGGLGNKVGELLATEGCPAELIKLAIPHDYCISGPYSEVLAYYELDADSIAARIEQDFKGVYF